MHFSKKKSRTANKETDKNIIMVYLILNQKMRTIFGSSVTSGSTALGNK